MDPSICGEERTGDPDSWVLRWEGADGLGLLV